MSSDGAISLNKLEVNGNNVGEQGHQSIGNKTGNHHLTTFVSNIIPHNSWSKLIVIFGVITFLLAVTIGVILGVLHFGKSTSPAVGNPPLPSSDKSD